MDKESTTFGLSPEKVEDLLKIGADVSDVDEKTDSNQMKAELLSNCLNDTLPPRKSVQGLLPKNLGPMRNTLMELTSEPIGKLLLDQETDLVVLERVKDYGKTLSKTASTKVEHEAANTIYYAAIARCMVSYGRRITKFSYKDLERSFYILSRKNWIPQQLREILTQASRHCKDRTEGSG